MSTPTPTRSRVGRLGRLLVIALVPLLAAMVLVWSTSHRQEKVDKIPVAVVNNDTIITKPQKMAAGRSLAAALTDPTHPDQNLDWTLTDSADAKSGMREGAYYAVLTIPSDFSKAILSSGTDKPTSGQLSLVSDQAASVTVPYISEKVASAAADSLGVQTTQGYLKNVYQGFNQLADNNKKAASNASSLASGTDQLNTGATQLDDGAGTLAGSLDQIENGAASLQSGTASVRSGADEVAQGTVGVSHGATSLHQGAGTLAGSAGKLAGSAGKLAGSAGKLAGSAGKVAGSSRQVAAGSTGVARGASGVADANAGLARATRLVGLELRALDRLCDPAGAGPRYCEAVARARASADRVAGGASGLSGRSATLAGSAQRVAAGSRKLAGGTAQLAGGARELAGGARQLSGGAHRLAGGARSLDAASARLSAGASSLVGGSRSVASGATTVDEAAGTLASGTQQSAAAGASVASGAASLSSSAGSVDHGANQLSSGLSKGAKQSPTYSSSAQKALEATVSQPVKLSHSLQNDKHGNGWLVAALVALVLWLAAMVGALRRDPGAALRDSGAPVTSRRLALGQLGPVLGLALVEGAAVLVALAVLRVPAAEVVPFALLTLLAAVTFTALAYATRFLLGRAGLAGLVLLLLVQVAALGNVIPLETAPAPLRTLNAVLPLTAYVDGASQLLTGGDVGSRVADTLVLLVWAGAAVLATVLAVRRRRLVRTPTAVGPELERMTGIEPA